MDQINICRVLYSQTDKNWNIKVTLQYLLNTEISRPVLKVFTQPETVGMSCDKIIKKLRNRISRGQSLVVWAINEGRIAAAEIDKYLEGGVTKLPGVAKGKALLTQQL